MNKVAFAILVCAFACASCATKPHNSSTPTSQTAASSGFSPERLQSQTQVITDAYAMQVATARGATLDQSPTIVIKATPQLISYDPETNNITVPAWAEQPEPVKAVFRKFSGGNEVETEKFFSLFFNQFLVAHEASHWFQQKTWKGTPPELYSLENDANRLAVAFWRTQPNGEEFLAELQVLAENAYKALPDPTPPGHDAADFFGQNYQELGADPIKYGYYQFKFMADALRDRSQLNFDRMVSRLHSGNDNIGK